MYEAIVQFRSLTETAIVPKRATKEAAGFDLHADGPALIAPHQTAIVGTGIAMAIPEGYEGQVRPRSGLAAKYGITVLNSPGTIDSDYRGEVKVILINHGTGMFQINPGDRIAQIVFAKVAPVVTVEVNELTNTARGTGGLGSTGV